MSYRQIMEKFKELFPAYIENIDDYRPQDGQNYSIHIWLKDGRELVFMYERHKEWLLETYEHFKMRMN